MDDQYGRILYEQLSDRLKFFDFPIKDNIKNPLNFVDDINDEDVILLDNFFPGKTWEEPLGANFLNEILGKYVTCKVICISDYGESLINRFSERKTAYEKGVVIGFVPDKTASLIEKFLKKI